MQVVHLERNIHYTEDTLPFFDFYDFLICNTKRHLQAMKSHPQKYYIKWGTNVNLYKPSEEKHQELTFFHSVGMSPRKGTDILVDAFVNGELYKTSKLIIHTQIPIERVCKYNKQQLEEYGIEIVEKTVTAPGLYCKGDVYVYPTRLDGLGLTMYEALASGLPLITTDFPPMNEVGDDTCVRLVKTKDFYCRNDAYYYPMAVCDEESLITEMRWFVNNKNQIDNFKKYARDFALKNYDIDSKSEEMSDAIVNAKIRELNPELYKKFKRWSLTQGNIISQILNLRVVYDFKNKLKNH